VERGGFKGGEGGVADAGDGAGAAEEKGVAMEVSVVVEEEKCGDTESEHEEEEPPEAAGEPVLAQSLIDAAFDAQLTINFTIEFEKSLKNYREVALNIK